MDYNKERYRELKILINQENFLEIGNYYLDYQIISKSDLKNLLITKYIKIKDTSKLTYLENLLPQVISSEEIYHNYELNIKLNIEKGLLSFDFISEPQEQNRLIQIFKEQLKNPNFQIKELPSTLRDNKEFINYCLKVKNLSILNWIDYQEEYLNKALTLIKEGYGFNFRIGIKVEYARNLLYPLIKAGYLENINSWDFYNNNILDNNNLVINTIKKHLNQGKGFSINSAFNLLRNSNEQINSLKELLQDKEIVRLLIQNNYLDCLPILTDDILNENLTLIDKKLKEGYSPNINIPITNSKLIKILLENNYLQCINYSTKESYQANSKLFLEKLSTTSNFEITNINNLKNTILSTKKELPQIIKYITKNNISNLLKIMNIINHDEKLISLYDYFFYQEVSYLLAKYYHLNKDNLDKFVKQFGYQYLYYIENDNLRKVINFKEVDFNKYLDLFKIDKLTLTNVQNIYDSILQFRFKKEHLYDIKRLSRIKSSLIKSEIPKQDLLHFATVLNIKEAKKINIFSDTELLEYQQDRVLYIYKLYNEMKNNQNFEHNLTIFYKINRYYLRKKREEYRSQHHYINELSLKTTFDKKSIIEIFIQEIAHSLSNESLENNIFSFKNLKFILEHEIQLQDLFKVTSKEDTLKKCFLFIKSSGQSYNLPEIKSHLKETRDLIEYLVVNKIIEKHFPTIKPKLRSKYRHIKKTYQVKENQREVLNILQELNPCNLQNKIFNDINIYNTLKYLLQKYKFIYWNNTFEASLITSDLSLERYDIVALINEFNELYKYLEMKKITKETVTLPEIINYTNILSQTSNRYQILLGKENVKYLKLNPNPNAAIVSANDKNARLEIAITDLLRLYNKKYITTPPLDEIISLGIKDIHINLGNFTNPINLTYGERTGSCMRIRGEGETFYSFCQTNQNSFHIRFTNPQTKNFISRVSGFRNGNSVFLNELRYSVDSNYTDNDLIEAIRQVSNILIEKSKDSSLPIDNVFITKQYVMENNTQDKIIQIKEDIFQNMNYFYFDLHHEGIVLATTSKETDYVPITTNIDSLPLYKTLRDNIELSVEPSVILERLNKIYILKEILTTNNPERYQEIDLISENQANSIIYLLTGEDWIAYLTKDLEIYSDYIDRNDNRTILELNHALEILNQKREEYHQIRFSETKTTIIPTSSNKSLSLIKK